MNFSEKNKYLKKMLVGLAVIILSFGILSACAQEENSSEATPIITPAATPSPEISPTPSISEAELYLNIISDEYVDEEISKLALVEENTVHSAGSYGVLKFTDKNSKIKVVVTNTFIYKEGDNYIGKVCDAFSKTIIFKYNVDPKSVFYIVENSIFYATPFFEDGVLESHGSIYDLATIAYDSGFMFSYVNPFLPQPYNTNSYEYTDLEVADFYIRLITDEYRVTAEEIAAGLDMNDPDVKIK